MQLQLTKHHGLGNDFLVVFHPDHDDLPALARQLCDRHRGVGADGLLVAESADGYAARMTLYNADGSRAEMSGNGIRCFAQALSARRGDLDPQRILTDAGDRQVELFATEHPDTLQVSVDMGPIDDSEAPAGWDTLGCHPDRPVLHLGLGNPHSVVGVDDVAEVDLEALGRKVPGTNLEIIEPGPGVAEIRMRVHERGAGITEACGTGACASAHAARQWGLVPAASPEIVVHMDGGSAKVRLDEPAAGRATLIGPTVLIATVTITITPSDPAGDTPVATDTGQASTA